MPKTNRRSRPSSEVVENEMGQEISLYHPRTERVMVLNETASDVWRLLDGNTSDAEIVELLASAYSTTPASIDADVRATVDRFVDEGFASD